MVVVKAIRKPRYTVRTPDVPAGLKECWLEQWTILSVPERNLPLGIEGLIKGDQRLKPGTRVQVYNLRRVSLVNGWVSTDTRVYFLGTKKDSA